MKRVKLPLFAFGLFLLSSAFFPADNNTINIANADSKMPDWQWTTGEVEGGNYATSQPITIVFDEKHYHPNDSIRITFNSFKVKLTNLTKGTTFSKWSDNISLVYNVDKKWLPVVKNPSDRMNKPFSGVNNNPVDSLTDYSFKTTVPVNRILIITVRVVGDCYFEDIAGPGAPMFAGGKGYPTFTMSIQGIGVKKITSN